MFVWEYVSMCVSACTCMTPIETKRFWVKFCTHVSYLVCTIPVFKINFVFWSPTGISPRFINLISFYNWPPEVMFFWRWLCRLLHCTYICVSVLMFMGIKILIWFERTPSYLRMKCQDFCTITEIKEVWTCRIYDAPHPVRVFQLGLWDQSELSVVCC